MRASPILSLIVLLISVSLTKPAVAEYPFDPMMKSSTFAPMDAPGSRGHSFYQSDLVEQFSFDGSYPGVDGVFSDEIPIWPGWISGNYQPGSDRSLYGGEWFQPLYQDGRNLWYFNFRGQGDDESASEFNVGTGFRALLDPGWIFGAYVFWDHLDSSNGNNFDQGLIGVEAMSVLWDARFNVYFPESGGQRVGAPRVRVSNGNLVVQSGFERAYWGFDLEAGHLIRAWGPAAQHELRGFLAIYHFDHSANGTESITGPRARLEWRWFDLPYFGPGSRLTTGLTVQADRVRNGQVFGFIQLRIPLDAWAHSRRRLSPLHRRMLDRVVRDVDIVTDTSLFSEEALNPKTGRPITGVHTIDASTPSISSIIKNSDPDDLFLLDGSAGDIPLSDQRIRLKSGQTVLGGGSMLNVRGEKTGLRATYHAPGTRPTLNFLPENDANYKVIPSALLDYAEPYGLLMDDQTTLRSVDIQGPWGLQVRHASDVWVEDVAIRKYGYDGIAVVNSHNVGIKNVTIEHSLPPHDPDCPDGHGISVIKSTDVSIEHAKIHDAQSNGIRILNSEDVTIKKVDVKDAVYDGIVVSRSTDVSLSDIKLHDVAQSSIPDLPGKSPRETAAIWLFESENTSITDVEIHGDSHYGIRAFDAEETWIKDVAIHGASHGITMIDGRNVEITNTKIVLPQETGETYWAGYHEVGISPYYEPEPEAILLGLFTVPQPRTGISMHGMLGTASIHESEVHGGRNGHGIAIFNHSGDSETTNVTISDSVVHGTDFTSGILVSSWGSHNLTAKLTNNEINTEAVGFHVNSRAGGKTDVLVDNNDVTSWIGATSWDDSTLNLVMNGNHLSRNDGGNHRIQTRKNGRLNLLYSGNTVPDGSGNTEFLNHSDTGMFGVEPLSGNNHSPVSTGAVDTLPAGTLQGLAPHLFN